MCASGLQVPGLALYAVWCVLFTGVCMGTRNVADTCDTKGDRQNFIVYFQDFTDKDRTRVLFVHSLAAAIFGVGTWIQMSALLFQISAKKRQLSSFVAYVNLVSMTTYVGCLSGWLAPLYGNITYTDTIHT